MRNEPKHVQACEEEAVRGVLSDEELVERCLKNGVSKDIIEKLLKEHRDALERWTYEGGLHG